MTLSRHFVNSFSSFIELLVKQGKQCKIKQSKISLHTCVVFDTLKRARGIWLKRWYLALLCFALLSLFYKPFYKRTKDYLSPYLGKVELFHNIQSSMQCNYASRSLVGSNHFHGCYCFLSSTTLTIIFTSPPQPGTSWTNLSQI